MFSNLIAGEAATQTFSPGGKHPRAATAQYQASRGCVADVQIVGSNGELHTSPFPVVYAGEVKQVRTPGPAHPHMSLPSELRVATTSTTSTTTTTTTTTLPADNYFMFPPVAVYCQPPSPAVPTRAGPLPPTRYGGDGQRQSSGSEKPPRSDDVDAAAAATAAGGKRSVCARLSVPTEGSHSRRRRRLADDDDDDDAGLSRSNSHPSHRQQHRRRSRRHNLDDVDDARCRQTEPLVERTS